MTDAFAPPFKEYQTKRNQQHSHCISFWVPNEEHKDWKENADSKGLPLGTLARLLMKAYYEGSIELHL